MKTDEEDIRKLEEKFNERELKIPKILLINDNSPEKIARIWRFTLSPSVDYCDDAHPVTEKNVKLYDVAIIDASEDIPINGYRTLSALLKTENPKMVIVGTSACGAYFDNAPESRQLYDERVSSAFLICEDIIDEIKIKLNKYGFKFPEGTSDFGWIFNQSKS